MASRRPSTSSTSVNFPTSPPPSVSGSGSGEESSFSSNSSGAELMSIPPSPPHPRPAGHSPLEGYRERGQSPRQTPSPSSSSEGQGQGGPSSSSATPKKPNKGIIEKYSLFVHADDKVTSVNSLYAVDETLFSRFSSIALGVGTRNKYEYERHLRRMDAFRKLADKLPETEWMFDDGNKVIDDCLMELNQLNFKKQKQEKEPKKESTEGKFPQKHSNESL